MEKVFLVTLLPVDTENSNEIFGVFSNVENAEIAIKQFSKEIESELVENTHYEIIELTLNKSNYLLSR